MTASFPIAFYLLVWVFTTPAKVDRQVVFTDRIKSKIECNSKAIELAQKAAALKLPFSRFVCIPVPKD